MGDKSKIAWTDATWNPVTGCTKVSAGCKHCYAERQWPRLAAMTPSYKGRIFTDVMCHPERLEQPLRWKRPRRVFVNSMSDLFHEDVPDDFIADCFNVMYEAKHHIFQVLTKRPERMRDFFLGSSGAGANAEPIPNVWLGVSVEDQATADERMPLLLETPAAIRWLSMEPLIGPVDFYELSNGWAQRGYMPWRNAPILTDIDWIVVGGESGHKARPMHPDWVCSIRDECKANDTPFFMKQLSQADRTNFKNFDYFPEGLQIREYPVSS
jgi:protein gp37